MILRLHNGYYSNKQVETRGAFDWSGKNRSEFSLKKNIKVVFFHVQNLTFHVQNLTKIEQN